MEELIELQKLQDEIIRAEKEIKRLQQDIKKERKKSLKFLIEVGKNFGFLFYSMPSEEERKALDYCSEYAPEQV